jgi:hypothetical protein
LVLVDAAATVGIVDTSDRLVPALAEAGRSWSNLASRWGDLALPGARLEEPLARAAAEVRAAYRQITHDTTNLAAPDVIATRPGLLRATVASLRAIEAGAELAHVVAEKANTAGLTGPARALSIRAHNDIELGLATSHPDGDVVWVSPADIHARRTVPVPRPVRQALCSASTATAAAASTAAATATLANANSKVAPLPGQLTPDPMNPLRTCPRTGLVHPPNPGGHLPGGTQPR